ncbi:MAG: peptidoglycan -binding protein [Hyphomicrobiales bacterium]|nr:peptidoglycan -binding protein [Hyphomicrobiales bacterium]MDE2115859.1 peptidoglycan -binding protein [Hyphomicrobiales bacterium]
MAARTRRPLRHIDYWPGFVDALSTMLLVIIFLLSVFMLSQFYLSRDVSGKDTALNKLNKQVEELTSLLALARASNNDAQANLINLAATLKSSEAEKANLQALMAANNANASASGGLVAAANQKLEAEKAISAQALSQVDILNQQIAALRSQLAAIQQALDASEAKDQASQARIADLGSRLNLALAQKVQELARYRSDFFGRLREILGNRPGIRTVGDRFVFDSDVLFASGQAKVSDAGKQQLDQLAGAVGLLDQEIPPEIPWILRVDGHTDDQPIHSDNFKSNWELSAARAISVVQYLITKGVEPNRLAAAGFGEFQPITKGTDPGARAQNRRIELKLTER